MPIPDGPAVPESTGTSHPPDAFSFRVSLDTQSGVVDGWFREVSGLSSEMKSFEDVEGGENRFVHALRKGVKHTELVLKRGIVPTTSPLVRWYKDSLANGLGPPIEKKSLTIALVDGSGSSISAWTFVDAYPIKWSVDGSDTDKSRVVIESIAFAYAYMTRPASASDQGSDSVPPVIPSNLER